MKTLYFSAPTATRKFCSTEEFPYSYRKEIDIHFSNFDGKIYKIRFVGSDYSIYFSNTDEDINFRKKIRSLENCLYSTLFAQSNINWVRFIIKKELKKYRGSYKINFSKIKKKYKRIKNKIISEEFWRIINSYPKLVKMISDDFGGFLPIDLENHFKNFVCSKMGNTNIATYIEKTTVYKFISIFD